MSTDSNKSSILTNATVKNAFRIILGMILFTTGTAHLTFARVEFLAQAPKWIPLSGDLIVVLSGIVELILGTSLIFLKQYRIEIGWITGIFFILIFPGNISQYVNGIDAFGLNTDTKRFIRLFFQPVLVAWAWWCTGAWQHWKQSKELD